MAEPENVDANDKNDASSQAEKTSLWKQLGSQKWLATVIALTVVAHVSLIALQGFRAAKGPLRHAEVTLGRFAYANRGDGGKVANAEFKLHIRLLEEVENTVQTRLAQRKFKVEQDIEELLRQAGGGDFDDPSLTELKRQIQERINQSLEMRAISEVVITDLVVTKRVKEETATEATQTGKNEENETIGVTEWREKPAG